MAEHSDKYVILQATTPPNLAQKVNQAIKLHQLQPIGGVCARPGGVVGGPIIYYQAMIAPGVVSFQMKVIE